MKQVADLHNRAMDLAEQAMVSELNGKHKEAVKISTEAFMLERKAALIVVKGGGPEPSRSVLLRSAASLAIDCEELREAERLISVALAGEPPEEICEELRDLLETVHFSRHLSLKGMRLDMGELQMSLNGNDVGSGIIDGTEFLNRAQAAEALLFRTAQRLNGKQFGEAKRDTMREFRPFFSVPRAASFAVSIRIGRPREQKMLPFVLEPKEIVDEVLQCLDDFKDEKVERLHERITDESYYNNFVGLARKLAPDGDRITMVGLSVVRGRKERQTVLKKPASSVWRPRIDGKDDKSPIVRVSGRFKGADDTSGKKSHWFKVEEEGTEGKFHTVYVPTGMLDDIVKPMWGEYVTVETLKKKSKLHFSHFVDEPRLN